MIPLSERYAKLFNIFGFFGLSIERKQILEEITDFFHVWDVSQRTVNRVNFMVYRKEVIQDTPYHLFFKRDLCAGLMFQLQPPSFEHEQNSKAVPHGVNNIKHQ